MEVRLQSKGEVARCRLFHTEVGDLGPELGTTALMGRIEDRNKSAYPQG
jgi:hypothetical protein